MVTAVKIFSIVTSPTVYVVVKEIKFVKILWKFLVQNFDPTQGGEFSERGVRNLVPEVGASNF